MIEYRGEIIEKLGSDWIYENRCWSNLELLKSYIDLKKEGKNPKLIEIKG